MRASLQLLLQSWRVCSFVLLIVAVVSPPVAFAQGAGSIQRLEQQLDVLAKQVQELKKQLDAQRKNTASKQDVEKIQRQVENNAEFRTSDSAVHLAGYGSFLYKGGDNI